MNSKIIWLTAVTTLNTNLSFCQDWNSLPVPASAGIGQDWILEEDISDDFNYTAPADNKGDDFLSKWDDFYHNSWTGPGLTVWDREHSFVKNGLLQIPANRLGTNKISTGCITSRKTVQYPVYVEIKAKITNSVLANAGWLLSPDDTQEIDFLEAYGSSYSDNAQLDQTWFAERIHVSHHVFIRQPFQDYQPTDDGSWYKDGTIWKDDFHTYGVHWIDPWNLEYYIDGKLVRKVSGAAIIDPKGYTNGTGLNKAMDIIINVEDQNWRSDNGITPSDKELSDIDAHTFKVDWLRVYKPTNRVITGIKENELHIYPNPNKHYLFFKDDKEISKVYLLNMNGEVLYEKDINDNEGSIFTKKYSAGTYLLNIKYQNGAETTKKVVLTY